MLSTLLVLFLSVARAQTAVDGVTAHPLYPIALYHVLNNDVQGRLPGLEWDTLDEGQKKQVRKELDLLVQEEQKIEERIYFIETLIKQYPRTTHREPAPARVRHIHEDRELDHLAARSSYTLLPQNRLQYLKRIADSIAFVARRSKTEPAKILELKGMAARLLLEAEWTIQATKGQPEQVAQEATKLWAVALIGSMAIDIVGVDFHSPSVASAGLVAILPSAVAFFWNVLARDSARLQPILKLPGAFRRSALKTAATLRRNFWIEVEVGLLQNGYSKNDFASNDEPEALQRAIESLAAGNLLDLRTIDCGANLRL